MRELYVYYRVRGTDAAAAEAEVVALQTELRAATPGLRARLLQRPDEQDGRQTWMEIYSMESAVNVEGVSARLEAAIEVRAADRLTHIDGSRHVEVFLACAS